jgi:nucleoside-diphosphate-sugar epimerase
MARIFIFGLGYSALALAGQLRSMGWEVAGTARRPEKIADLRRLGFTVYPFSRAEPLSGALAALTDFPYILHSVPPDELGDPVYDLHSCALMQQQPRLRWLGYLSSTGVYGNHGGAVVTETTPCAPTSPSGMRRLQAETRWQELQQQCGVPVHRFRLAGIYGPGRSVLQELRRGTARQIIKPDHVFNRIHVADIAQSVLASMQAPAAGTVYNLADDLPASSAAVVRYGADLLGMPPPPPEAYATANLSAMAQNFYADHKIVSNAKLQTELGVRLLYPTYREGLRACL